MLLLSCTRKNDSFLLIKQVTDTEILTQCMRLLVSLLCATATQKNLKPYVLITSQKKAVMGPPSLSTVKERIATLTSNIKKLRLKKAQQTAKLAMIQAQEAKNDAEMLRLSSLDTSAVNI